MLHSNLIDAIGDTPLSVMLSEAKHLARVEELRNPSGMKSAPDSNSY